MRRRFFGTVLPVIVFMFGLCVLLYPTASDLWNQWRQNQLMDSYDQSVQELSKGDRAVLLKAAHDYNDGLDPAFADAFSGEQPEVSDAYWGLLDVDGTGIMGYIEIPKIEVRLPIYHGTSSEVLQEGVGHLAGTSLPVGGAGTHSVLSAHRGLPGALLFSDLDQLARGDRFCLNVLGEELAYEVDSISVVEPDEVSSLTPDATGDYVTLLTCTPYGVNTQRLLVRGHRVADMGDEGEVSAWARMAQSLGTGGKIALAVLGLLVVVCIIHVARKRTSDGDPRACVASREGMHFDSGHQ